MKLLFYYIVINLVTVAVYFNIAYQWSSVIYIPSFINTNRDVSGLVKRATRSGLVSYVGKVVGPGDWDNITRNAIFRGREEKSFYNIHKSCR